MATSLALLAVVPNGSNATPPQAASGSALARPAAKSALLPNLRITRDGFLGSSDKLILDRLIQGRVRGMKKGSGGRSLGFKLSFESGTKAYFKPAQIFSGAIWYAEVAAYHLDRMLGMGRVPPVTSYRMPWAPLAAVAGGDRRLSEVRVNADGTVDGALVYWLPEKLRRAKTPPGWENWIRVRPYSRYAITPYQRPSSYTAALQRHKARRPGGRKERYFDSVPEPRNQDLAPALSDMLVLDFLTLNIDRWGGNNGNVLCYGDTSPTLIFLDNGAGFSDGPHRRGLMDDRLAPQERFRRATVEALRAFELADLQARLSGEVLSPILDRHLLRGVQVRRDALLEHVDGLIAKHGEDAVLAWP